MAPSNPDSTFGMKRNSNRPATARTQQRPQTQHQAQHENSWKKHPRYERPAFASPRRSNGHTYPSAERARSQDVRRDDLPAQTAQIPSHIHAQLPPRQLNIDDDDGGEKTQPDEMRKITRFQNTISPTYPAHPPILHPQDRTQHNGPDPFMQSPLAPSPPPYPAPFTGPASSNTTSSLPPYLLDFSRRIPLPPNGIFDLEAHVAQARWPIPLFHSVEHATLIREGMTQFHLDIFLALEEADEGEGRRRELLEGLVDRHMPVMRQLEVRDDQIVWFFQARGDVEVARELTEVMKGWGRRMLEEAMERIERERWRYGGLSEHIQEGLEDWREDVESGASDCDGETEEVRGCEDESSQESDVSSQSSQRTITENSVKDKKLKGWDMNSKRGKGFKAPDLNDKEWPTLGT